MSLSVIDSFRSGDALLSASRSTPTEQQFSHHFERLKQVFVSEASLTLVACELREQTVVDDLQLPAAAGGTGTVARSSRAGRAHTRRTCGSMTPSRIPTVQIRRRRFRKSESLSLIFVDLKATGYSLFISQLYNSYIIVFSSK